MLLCKEIAMCTHDTCVCIWFTNLVGQNEHPYIYGLSYACILQSLEFLATAECFNGTQYSALHAASIQYIRLGLPIPSIHLNFCFQFTSAKTKFVEVQSQLSLHAFLLSLKTCTESRNVVTACFCSFVNTWQYLDTMQN